MNDGEFNDISRAIGALESGLRSHEMRTDERHAENQVTFAAIRQDIAELKSWKWRVTGFASGIGAAAAVVAPYIKKLFGLGS